MAPTQTTQKTERTFAVPVAAAALLIAFTLGAASLARTTGMGAVKLAEASAAVAQSKTLRIQDRSDGALVVTDIDRPSATRVIAPGTNGFLRVVLDSLARDRLVAGVGDGQIFRVTREESGRLWIEDLATSHKLLLDAFGVANARTVAQFLEDRRASR